MRRWWSSGSASGCKRNGFGFEPRGFHHSMSWIWAEISKYNAGKGLKVKNVTFFYKTKYL